MPYSAAKYLTRRYIKQVQSLLSAKPYDAIVIDHAQLGWLLNDIKHLRVILVAHNLEHEMYRQHFQRSGNASDGASDFERRRNSNQDSRCDLIWLSDCCNDDRALTVRLIDRCSNRTSSDQIHPFKISILEISTK